MDAAPRCAHCGEVIGASEPTIVVEYGESSETAEPELIRLAKWHYHQECHDALQAAREPPE